MYLFLFLAITLQPVLGAILIELRQIPYNANVTALCRVVIDQYFVIKPSNVATYCQTQPMLKMSQFEITEILLPNATCRPDVELDTYPTNLTNTLNSTTNFFEHSAHGQIILVANLNRLTHQVYILLGSYAGFTVIYLLILAFLTIRPLTKST